MVPAISPGPGETRSLFRGHNHLRAQELRVARDPTPARLVQFGSPAGNFPAAAALSPNPRADQENVSARGARPQAHRKDSNTDPLPDPLHVGMSISRCKQPSAAGLAKLKRSPTCLKVLLIPWFSRALSGNPHRKESGLTTSTNNTPFRGELRVPISLSLYLSCTAC